MVDQKRSDLNLLLPRSFALSYTALIRNSHDSEQQNYYWRIDLSLQGVVLKPHKMPNAFDSLSFSQSSDMEVMFVCYLLAKMSDEIGLN